MKLIIYLSLLSLVGCAGPTHPFGHFKGRPIKGLTKEDLERPNRLPASLFDKKSNAKISFLPKAQNLHSKMDWEIQIFDKDGITAQSQFEVYFDGKKITKQIRDIASINTNEDGKSINIKIPNTRLRIKDGNHIFVTYKRNPYFREIHQYFEPPACSFFEFQQVNNVPGYQASNKLINYINQTSLQHQVNPAMMAGLIAQESSFNPNAVSWAKAIGLTQVTPAAETEIFNKLKSPWPQYPQLNKLNVAEIKALILLGKVNEETEWRLNPKQSIQGGIEYIKYLEKYWTSEKVQKEISPFFNHNEPWDDLILASYNSGASRVKRAIHKHGKNWIQSNELNEARNYVKKIHSYCFHFSN